MSKKVFMIAGPNGAGKTTTAMPLIQNIVIHEFLNADEIARGLAPLHPESVSLSASKLMLKRLDELLVANKSFAFETTASGINYVKHLKRAREQGYKIHLLFLWLSSPDLAVKRVAKRVSQGGHNIPEDTIRRRYRAGIKNLIKEYLPLSDSALILDNSLNKPNKVIAIKNDAELLKVEDANIWEEIERIAHGNT
ncbi:MAG TPA: AAA family ATPase [Parachlamydiaceae bacterium]|nr:AAA family ATPase [Parachlamydiaceae bacterium]